MSHDHRHAPSPQEVQCNGQSAISQDSPLTELHQEGKANTDRPADHAIAPPELTDEEVSLLCDIGGNCSTTSHKFPLTKSLINRGLVLSAEHPVTPLKLTFRAQQLLSKRGVGLNES
jgi:hypothetical protein